MNEIAKQELVRMYTNLTIGLTNLGLSWCLCFGSLLSLVRDRRLIASGQDIDIGILADPVTAYAALRASYAVSGVVLDDVTGEPYQAKFGIPGMTIDTYFWRRKGGYAYHCFDEQHETPASGKLKSYHFKGIPDVILYPTAALVSKVDNECRMYRRINADNTYNVPCPGIEEEGLSLRVPFGFGAALDCWYPGCWAIPNPQYGQSRAIHEFTVQTCRGIGWR